MVLVDTSVWISHLRYGNAGLSDLLMEGKVLCHPFVIGELACGNLSNRDEILALLSELPQATLLENDEIPAFIERNKPAGLGIGLIDVHLLASARLSGASVWTMDKRLQNAAKRVKILFDPAG